MHNIPPSSWQVNTYAYEYICIQEWSNLGMLFINITRSTHAHLCLTPACRLCVCVICGCRWGARGTCYVCCRRSCLVCEKSCLVWETSCEIWGVYCGRGAVSCWRRAVNCSNCIWVYVYVTKFHMTFLSVTHHVCTYVRTMYSYFVRIDPWFRALR